MSGPIQVILNTEDYQQAREVGGGGPHRDFFAFRDPEFRTHKRVLITQLAALSRILANQPQGPMGVIKLTLRREAWAKSHRPIRTLFRLDRIAMVGGGDLGVIYFEAFPEVLDAIARDIGRAEETTRLKAHPETGREVPNPSSMKSETGAILRIELYGPDDRRNFSAEAAVNWLSNPMTGSTYQVELFEMPPPRSQWDAKGAVRQKIYTSFVEGLAALGQGLDVHRVSGGGDREQPQIAVRLARTAEAATVQLASPPSLDRRRGREVIPFDADVERHQRLLRFLDKHPLVRRVELPPIVAHTVTRARPMAQATAGVGRVRPEGAPLPQRNTARTYPKVGIIDGGIGGGLSDWIIGRWDILSDEHINADHGSFIGGLTVAGQRLNSAQVCPEADGTELVDIAVFPDGNAPGAFASYYPDGIRQLFEEIGYAVADAKARHDVRIFNMSLNILMPAAPDRYSSYAKQLDDIAEAHNAVIFISAGNTAPQDHRPEWPTDETRALVNLATARNDALLMPAESTRNVSVGALNPPGLSNVLPFAPARYSRRGPGLRAGVKPDLAHIGGSGTRTTVSATVSSRPRPMGPWPMDVERATPHHWWRKRPRFWSKALRARSHARR